MTRARDQLGVPPTEESIRKIRNGMTGDKADTLAIEIRPTGEVILSDETDTQGKEELMEQLRVAKEAIGRGT